MVSEAEAVEALSRLGLSEYEARCFVALSQLSTGTAKEVAQVADVPQSRVYDITEQLHNRGLVDIQQSDPKKYCAVSVEHALQTLQEEYNAHLDVAEANLQALEGRQSDDAGVWGIATRRDVRNRVVRHIRHADEALYLLVAREELLEDKLLAALAEAASNEVTLWVEGPTPATKQLIHDDIPAAAVAVTDFSRQFGSGLPQNPGRLLMVDGETILLSAQQEGLVPNEVEESGVWGSAAGHGLVVWMHHLLESRRQTLEFETAR